MSTQSEWLTATEACRAYLRIKPAAPSLLWARQGHVRGPQAQAAPGRVTWRFSAFPDLDGYHSLRRLLFSRNGRIPVRQRNRKWQCGLLDKRIKNVELFLLGEWQAALEEKSAP